MKIYTKTGDMGQTGLLNGRRVFKDDERVEAYGTMDEANAAIGLAKSLVSDRQAAALLESVQNDLVLLNADLAGMTEAGPPACITAGHVEKLERLIDSWEEKRIPQPYFVAPGLSTAGAALDLARTVVRRTERRVVRLKKRGEYVPDAVVHYLNRLSDLLYVLARRVEQEDIVRLATQKVLDILRRLPEKQGKKGIIMLTKAKAIIAAAERKADEIGVPMVIAVVDAGGNLVAQHRMDGALLASISIALDKAYTAAALKMPTDQVGAEAVPGKPLFGIHAANGGRIVIFGGGLPIVENGIVVGGLGVSGGTVDEDMIVAKAGLSGC